MPRNRLYESAQSLNVWLPTHVVKALQGRASRQRRSVSQVVAFILEEHLRERGELPVKEEAAV